MSRNRNKRPTPEKSGRQPRRDLPFRQSDVKQHTGSKVNKLDKLQLSSSTKDCASNASGLPVVVLKAKACASLKRHHPWVFRGAISEMRGDPSSGETVDLSSEDGQWLGQGAYSTESQIAVRVWTFDQEEDIDREFFERRIGSAIAARSDYLEAGEARASRIVNAESDGLPGLTVDRYADFLVCQFLSAGAVAWRDTIIDILRTFLPNIAGIYERSDVDVLDKEGLVQRTGLLWGDEPPDKIEISEYDCRYLVDVRAGHKTGFYLDQRDNRAIVAELAADKEVLNCFSYTGGFGVSAMRGGAARVVNIDSSGPALALVRRHAELNELDQKRMENVETDVFKYLRNCRDGRREFDLIILDPPKFASSRHQVDKAARAYKDINLLAFKLLRPGGLLVTFSCSGHISRDLFQKIVADAALDAGRHAVILRWLSQSSDHACGLPFPEGMYLKGLVCRID